MLKSIKEKGIKEASKSPCNSKHAAFIVKKNKIIAKGYNNPRTSFLGMIKCCQHAEMSAITKFNNCILEKITNKNKKKRIINKCKIYILRISNKNSNFTFSAPCKDCYKKLKEIGFTKIYFTDYNGEFIKININTFKTKHLSFAQQKFNKTFKIYKNK